VDHEVATVFDSIESAHQFVALLGKAVQEARKEIEGDVQRELSSNAPRRLDALRIAVYSLQKLELHVNRSGRILNDLRSLRRLLFEERNLKALTLQSKAHAKAKPPLAAKAELPESSLPPLQSRATHAAAKSEERAAA
jgi:hypothetical protein